MLWRGWKKIIINALVTGMISALSCLIAGSNDMSQSAFIGASLAGLLSFFIEVKNETKVNKKGSLYGFI